MIIFVSSNYKQIYDKKMKEQRVSIRASILALEVGEFVELPRDLCRVSTTRNAASIIAADYRRKFTVTFNDEVVVVTRLK